MTGSPPSPPTPLPPGLSAGGGERGATAQDPGRVGCSARDRLLSRTAVHALAWLAAGNAVGLLAATLLLFPAANGWLAPWTYGRWLAVHLDLQLYGWCGLALVALLVRALAGGEPPRLLGIAVDGWSGALAAGAVAWLAGRTSGKLFLDWTGPARVLFVAELVLLWVALAAAFARARSGEGWSRAGVAARGALLAVLATVPAALWWTTDPATYPPVNPATGGPTGASLLASTLAILPVFLALPALLGLPERAGARRAATVAWSLFAVHAALLVLGEATVGGGDRGHRDAFQIAAVASVVVWPPVVAAVWRLHAWPAAARRWRTALAAWGAVLAGSAVANFLPGVLDRVKFTDVLVGHAHLAMAGMATCFNALVLAALGGVGAAALGRRRPFWLWQGGCAAMVAALTAAGLVEAADPAATWDGNLWVAGLYALRWLAGAVMLAGSIEWVRAAVRARRAGEVVEEEREELGREKEDAGAAERLAA